MIIGIGIDIVENFRIKKTLLEHKLSFVKKILTKKELLELSQEKVLNNQVAGIFAAKEAVIKSLTNFLGFSLNFQEVTIKKNQDGVPKVIINNQIAKQKIKKVQISLSISHEKSFTVAIAIAELFLNN